MLGAERAGVTIVTLAVPKFPSAVAGMSGYLVPKPDSAPCDGGFVRFAEVGPLAGTDEIVRVSLGRDGLPIDDLDDATLVDAAVRELGGHLGNDIEPTASA